MMDLSGAENEFKEQGTVVFSVTKKESVLLKKKIKLLLKLERTMTQKGIGNFLLKKLVMFQGIFVSLKTSCLSEAASQVFDFFVLHKHEVGSVEAKEASDGSSVLFVFKKARI